MKSRNEVNAGSLSNTLLVKLGLGVLGIVMLVVMISSYISFQNETINIVARFEAKKDSRTAFYDKLYKIISQTSQIVVKNDQSFKENVKVIMDGRKDSEQVFMKWITETNPNANFSEVSSMYKELARTIEAQREGFFVEETVLMDIVRQYKVHTTTFPNSFYNIFYGAKPLDYTPIQSSLTQEVMRTGIDNNIKLDL